VTRGQAASFISRVLEAAGADLPVDPPDAFDDDDGSVHETAIDGLAALGIIRGTAPRTFEPTELVSRAQMASLVVRAHEHVTGDPLTPTTDHFTDDDGNVHEDAINIAADLGIVLGTAPGTFEPAAPIRRDQTASILVRLVEALAAAVTP
jgi:hypothetical protein